MNRRPVAAGFMLRGRSTSAPSMRCSRACCTIHSAAHGGLCRYSLKLACGWPAPPSGRRARSGCSHRVRTRDTSTTRTPRGATLRTPCRNRCRATGRRPPTSAAPARPGRPRPPCPRAASLRHGMRARARAPMSLPRTHCVAITLVICSVIRTGFFRRRRDQRRTASKTSSCGFTSSRRSRALRDRAARPLIASSRSTSRSSVETTNASRCGSTSSRQPMPSELPPRAAGRRRPDDRSGRIRRRMRRPTSKDALDAVAREPGTQQSGRGSPPQGAPARRIACRREAKTAVAAQTIVEAAASIASR